MDLKIVDLFAGTGSISLAFQKYGGKIVFSNDICAESEKIYNLNFKHKLFLGDINNIKPEDIPKHNIICMGIPCQPFSIAGKKKGFEDERSNVFWSILKIIKFHIPDIIIIENVKNLKSHDKGKTFETIYDNIKNIGYHIKYSILNTSDITNIPQNRERIFIICFKNIDIYNKFNFNFNKIENLSISNFLENNVDDKYYYNEKYKIWDSIKDNITKNNVVYQYRRYYVRENKNNVCPTLTANMGEGGHNVPLIKDNKGIRKLTPRECFNLQGFSSSYKLPTNLSDSKLYKLAGNAITTKVIELIVEKIIMCYQ